MKKTFNLICLITLLAAALPTRAQVDISERKRYDNFKERNISKTYPAAGNSLEIDNSFGNVKVTTWDKNEIKVDIHIEASSTDKNWAEKTFESITVTDKQAGNKISFKTEHKDVSNNCKNCRTSMITDYEVYMPATNTLSIENSFGDIVVPDYSGTISLNSQFGSLTAGKLPKSGKLRVEFGRADIKSAANVDASFKFSRVLIDQLSGNNKVYMEFCSFSKFSLAGDLGSLKIDESYSTVNLNPAAGLSASYDISTSFGSVADRSNIGIKRTDTPDQYGPDSEKKYEGKSGSGAAKIDINSSFGRIIIGEATADEMKDKKDRKEKRVVMAFPLEFFRV